MVKTHLGLFVPTDIYVTVNCHSDQGPNAVHDEEIEYWESDIGVEDPIGI